MQRLNLSNHIWQNTLPANIRKFVNLTEFSLHEIHVNELQVKLVSDENAT